MILGLEFTCQRWYATSVRCRARRPSEASGAPPQRWHLQYQRTLVPTVGIYGNHSSLFTWPRPSVEVAYGVAAATWTVSVRHEPESYSHSDLTMLPLHTLLTGMAHSSMSRRPVGTVGQYLLPGHVGAGQETYKGALLAHPRHMQLPMLYQTRKSRSARFSVSLTGSIKKS